MLFRSPPPLLTFFPFYSPPLPCTHVPSLAPFITHKHSPTHLTHHHHQLQRRRRSACNDATTMLGLRPAGCSATMWWCAMLHQLQQQRRSACNDARFARFDARFGCSACGARTAPRSSLLRQPNRATLRQAQVISMTSRHKGFDCTGNQIARSEPTAARARQMGDGRNSSLAGAVTPCV